MADAPQRHNPALDSSHFVRVSAVTDGATRTRLSTNMGVSLSTQRLGRTNLSPRTLYSWASIHLRLCTGSKKKSNRVGARGFGVWVWRHHGRRAGSLRFYQQLHHLPPAAPHSGRAVASGTLRAVFAGWHCFLCYVLAKWLPPRLGLFGRNRCCVRCLCFDLLVARATRAVLQQMAALGSLAPIGCCAGFICTRFWRGRFSTLGNNACAATEYTNTSRTGTLSRLHGSTVQLPGCFAVRAGLSLGNSNIRSTTGNTACGGGNRRTRYQTQQARPSRNVLVCVCHNSLVVTQCQHADHRIVQPTAGLQILSKPSTAFIRVGFRRRHFVGLRVGLLTRACPRKLERDINRTDYSVDSGWGFVTFMHRRRGTVVAPGWQITACNSNNSGIAQVAVHAMEDWFHDARGGGRLFGTSDLHGAGASLDSNLDRGARLLS